MRENQDGIDEIREAITGWKIEAEKASKDRSKGVGYTAANEQGRYKAEAFGDVLGLIRDINGRK